MQLSRVMRNLHQDLRFGVRVLANSPGFLAVAVLTLGLGIAVNTTVFGWMDAVVLNPFPMVSDPDQLLLLESVSTGGENTVHLSYLDYRDFRDNLKLLSGLAIARHTPLSIGLGGRQERAWAELVSANYFDVLGVKPALGRGFLPEEAGDTPGAHPVAVISDRIWRTRFRADPEVLGKRIRSNRVELTIVGVAPPGFRGTGAGLIYDLWAPITMAPAMGTGEGTLDARSCRDLTGGFARLKPGVTLAEARGEAAALAGRLAATYPNSNRGFSATLQPLRLGHNMAQRLLARPLQILMAACLLVLLIVCANVANLLLARAVSRNREFGLRQAMGAGRLRLARQLLTETLLLALAGGFAGVVLSLWLAPALSALLPPNDLPISVAGEVNVRSLVFTLLVCLAVTLLAGTAPALLSVRSSLNETLKEGGRGGGLGRGSHRLRGMLVVAEVALAAVAIIGALLFYRSFHNAGAIDPGFDAGNISVSQFYLSSAGYSAMEQRQFCRTLRERMEATPGVVAAGYSDVVPLFFGSSPSRQLEIDGYTPGPREIMTVHRSFVPPGYFQMLRIPLLEGRDFTESDDESSGDVIVVNQTFARRYFGGRSPLGRNVKLGNRQATIVGMVRDARYHSTVEPPIPYFYAPFRQHFAPGLNFAFFIKAAGDPTALTATLRKEALALNPDAVFTTTRLSEAAAASLYPQKVAAGLLSALAAVALLMAAAGLFSVMSYAVSQRTRELGIRMAMGARRLDVLALVAAQGFALTLPGLLLGVAAAVAGSRLVSGMLVGVRAEDPATLSVSGLLLLLVALLACAAPAFRATRVDPIRALRCE